VIFQKRCQPFRAIDGSRPRRVLRDALHPAKKSRRQRDQRHELMKTSAENAPVSVLKKPIGCGVMPSAHQQVIDDAAGRAQHPTQMIDTHHRRTITKE